MSPPPSRAKPCVNLCTHRHRGRDDRPPIREFRRSGHRPCLSVPILSARAHAAPTPSRGSARSGAEQTSTTRDRSSAVGPSDVCPRNSRPNGRGPNLGGIRNP